MNPKRILKVLLLVLIAAALSVLMGWAYVSGSAADRAVTCRKIDVRVKGAHGENFVSPDEVRAAVTGKFGDLYGKKLCEMDLVAIENYVDSRSAVLKSEVYVTRDSVLDIAITQRHPVLRFEKEGRGCYCDDRGNLFPLQGRTAARVPVVDGSLPVDPTVNGQPENARSRRWVHKMIALADYIEHSQWKSRVNQMSVRDGDLVIYLKDTKERFIFGTPDDIEDKFDRIQTYFEAVRPAVGEGFYSTVNVKFENQLVCRK